MAGEEDIWEEERELIRELENVGNEKIPGKIASAISFVKFNLINIHSCTFVKFVSEPK